MIVRRRWLTFVLPALLGIAILAQQSAQYPASLLAGLRWRDVGPMRGGRTYGVAGHVSLPDTYYFGSVGGGVWKTENSGRTWVPISDEGIPIGSIGAIDVAPSNANIVYVGTGEPDIRSQHSYGIGMFKSADAGKTWSHIGLEATRQIGRVVVDPANANRVYVAALGNVYASNSDRGVYRTLDGGATWKKVLFNTTDPNNVGAIDLALDPKIRARSMQPSGPLVGRHGPSTRLRICPEVDSINRPMAEIPGHNSLADFPMTSSSERSALPSRRAILIDSGRSSTISEQALFLLVAGAVQRRTPAEVFTSRTMPEEPGSWLTPKLVFGAAAGISGPSASIPEIQTAPTSSIPRPT